MGPIRNYATGSSPKVKISAPCGLRQQIRNYTVGSAVLDRPLVPPLMLLFPHSITAIAAAWFPWQPKPSPFVLAQFAYHLCQLFHAPQKWLPAWIRAKRFKRRIYCNQSEHRKTGVARPLQFGETIIQIA